jgi:acyl-coenzyme A synthetase/AMP-(fatty) acid ligase
VIAQTLLSQARFFSNRIAVVDGDRGPTFSDLARRSSRLAFGLDGLGCRPGDRVAIIPPTRWRSEWFFACAAGGFLGLAVNTRLGVAAVKEMLEDASPRAVIVNAREAALALADELREAGSLPAIEVGFGNGRRGLDYKDVLAASSDRVYLPDRAPRTPFLLTATSGTTGR